MPYTKQTWVDNDPSRPLSASRMNYIETGLEAAQATAEDKSPAAHTHPTAQVVGLDTTLSGKASTSHSHTVADITATGTRSDSTFLRGDGNWAAVASGGEGVSDHGLLTGLGDDDHTIYHTDARGDVRYNTKAEVTTLLAGKAATVHTHSSTQITDSTATGRAVIAAADAAAARTAIGAGTGSSDLTLGITGTTAAAGDVVVRLTGSQTVAGVKTFSSSPVVPDASFTVAKTTGLQSALDGKAQVSASVGHQTWNGTAWSTRPTGFLYVEAFSDGTAGSTRDSAAPEPTGAVNGDRWWKALT